DTDSVSVRLVMTPDRMVVDEARRTFTYLNLYGYLTDAGVVNRLFPAEVGPGGLPPGPPPVGALLRRGGRRARDARPPRRPGVRGARPGRGPAPGHHAGARGRGRGGRAGPGAARV